MITKVIRSSISRAANVFSGISGNFDSTYNNFEISVNSDKLDCDDSIMTIIRNSLSISPRRSVKIGSVTVEPEVEVEVNRQEDKNNCENEREMEFESESDESTFIPEDKVSPNIQSNCDNRLVETSERHKKLGCEVFYNTNIPKDSGASSDTDDSNSDASFYTLPNEIHDLTSALNPVVSLTRLQNPVNGKLNIYLDKSVQNWERKMLKGKEPDVNDSGCKTRQNNVHHISKSSSLGVKSSSQCSVNSKSKTIKHIPKSVPSVNSRSVLTQQSQITKSSSLVKDSKSELNEDKNQCKKVNKSVNIQETSDEHEVKKNVKSLAKRDYEEMIEILVEFLEVQGYPTVRTRYC
ncbi:UNVERIFIED_CONTAM: hypothetical protein PYX00_010618 [Menopon gallinae]|uniref:Uncharacterized protein n=1 Tax=Menopon gallinae TaxID=328185 RepID=A0AAW2HG97_9NEOP